jgi:hypothetical protein
MNAGQLMLQLDHIAIAAASLQQGVDYVQSALGVELSTGGQHDFMGTHNKLLRLGNDCYLEVIAIDPSIPAPERKRWFNLDDAAMQNSLKAQPRIIHWVARTADITLATMTIAGAHGSIVSASRGDLKWKITVTEDGNMVYDGAFPTFIEWPTGPHIASRMPDRGCKLVNLTIEHPSATTIASLLKPYFRDWRVKFENAPGVAFKAVIETPNGMRELV